MEFAGQPAGLRKQLSEGSDIIVDIVVALSLSDEAPVAERIRLEEKVVIALHAIRWGVYCQRISEVEGGTLKDQIINQLPLDPRIVGKLSVGDQLSIQELEESMGQHHPRQQVLESALHFIQEAEAVALRDAAGVDPDVDRDADIAIRAAEHCVICGTSKDVAGRGLTCDNSEAGHFHCHECITNWTDQLNEQRISNMDLFRLKMNEIIFLLFCDFLCVVRVLLL